jgi:hypothetical protein
MLPLFLSAAGQVALVALVLGAGLPALFAVGVRSFALASPDTSGRVAGSGSARRVLQAVGALCFAVVVLAVVVGLTLIIATGLGQTVSFEHVYPTFAPKA